MHILLIFASLLILSALLVDAASSFLLWQSRIHIGRWEDLDQWREAVRRKCEKWLRRPPTVTLSDNRRLIALDMLRGQWRSHTIQSWQQAGLIMGLCAEHGQVDFNECHKIATNTINSTEEVDSALIAFALLDGFPDKAEALRPLMDKMYARICQLRTTKGTIPYRKQIPDLRFVDTVGFVCPFLMLYAKTYNASDASDLAMLQLKEYDAALLHTWGFPAHAYSTTLCAPLGLHDWGRGMGWYIIALLGMHRHAVNETIRHDMRERILKLGEKLQLCALPGGGFAHQLFNANLSAEGSATVLGTILMQRCHEFSGENKYSDTANQAIQRLKRMTRRDGTLDHCQGDTKGIGVYSTRFDLMPFAQGLLLKLLTAIQ